MSIIEGIGDEVTNFFVVVIFFIIIYFAWKSTNVRDVRLPRSGVFVVNGNQHRIVQRIPLGSVLQTPQQRSALNLGVGDNASDTSRIDETNTVSYEGVLQTVAASISADPRFVESNIATRFSSVSLEEDEDEGPEEIIREMDNDTTDDGLRRRRIEAGSSDQHEVERTLVENHHGDDSTDNIDNCTNENNENGNVVENISLLETDNQATTTSPTSPETATQSSNVTSEGLIQKENEFRIKIKYLNDDLKLVKGTPSEQIGDFKKRNFTAELSDQKMIRLVFNGHVLQPDSKTLKACGLFDNCVVHCLVRNSGTQSATPSNNSGDNRLNDGDIDNGNTNTTNRLNGLNNTNDGNLNTTDEQRLVFLGIFLSTITLAFCWYYRIQYNHLFSWYSTIGLVLLSVSFFIIIPLLYFIERTSVSTAA